MRGAGTARPDGVREIGTWRGPWPQRKRIGACDRTIVPENATDNARRAARILGARRGKTRRARPILAIGEFRGGGRAGAKFLDGPSRRAANEPTKDMPVEAGGGLKNDQTVDIITVGSETPVLWIV